MKNVDIAKKEIKLSKFKNVIAIGTVILLFMSPTIAGISYMSDTFMDNKIIFLMLAVPGFFINMGMALKMSEIFSINDKQLQVFNRLFVRSSVNKFESNNENNILIIRQALDFEPLSDIEKQKIYKLCAEILVDENLYSDTYASWMKKLSNIHFERKDIENQFKRTNLLSLVHHIKTSKGFDKAVLDREIDLLLIKDVNENKAINLYEFFKSQINSTPLPLSSQKTLVSIKEKKYSLKDKDYEDIARIVKEYQGASFPVIEKLLKDLPIGQVSWIKIKSIIEVNDKSFSQEYLNMMSFLNDKIPLENAYWEHQQIVLNSAPKANNQGGKEALQENIALPTINQDTSIFLNKYEALNFTPAYHQDLWKSIKDEYDLVFKNKDKMEPLEFKKLNIMLHSTIPLLKSSDYSLNNINASASNPTQNLLRQNLEMVLSEMINAKTLIESKVHNEVLVENTYLKMKAKL